MTIPPNSAPRRAFAGWLALSAWVAAQAAALLPAFPGAEGFGAAASGGRGGAVYHVTTLADVGPGSFRDAVSQPHRTVVFEVGGTIRLAANLSVSSDLTIAGETAPGEGICLYGGSVSLGGQGNIILRYLRFREGIAGDRGRKSLGMDRGAHDIIIDHCSMEWGRWDNLGITVNSHDITVQYCLLAEGINPQSFGALIDSVERVTLSHNLWQSNESRNPKAKGTIQYINNVVYNWGITGLCGGHSAGIHSLDVIGNYFSKGPSSNDRFAGQFMATDQVYQTGNYADLDRDGKLNGQRVTEAGFHDPADKTYTLPTFVSVPAMHPAIPVAMDDATTAYAKIVAGAGCSRQRDLVDRRLISELTSLGTKGKTIPHTDASGEALAGGLGEVHGGPAPIDTDRDGIPDEWESAHQLNPHDPSDALKVQPSGYTQLEEYLHSLVDSGSGQKL